MTLSDVSIRNPVFAWMLMAALILFGWISFNRMGISEMPDVDFPVVAVHLSLEGAAPEVMEADVVDVVEDAVTAIQGVREIASSCREGAAVVTIEFELDRNIDAAVQEVQTKIAQAQMRLPKEMDPPVVTKTNPEEQPIMWIGLSGNRPLRELMQVTRDVLKDRFQTLSGVGEVFLGGFLEPSLRVWIDRKKLQNFDLTVEDVVQAIEAEHIEVPAGRIETPDQEFTIRAMGEASTPDSFGEIAIQKRGGQPVYTKVQLKEVARIEAGLSDIRRVSRVMGQTAVGLGIRKQRGANAVAVAERVRKKVDELQKTLPAGMKLGINFDSTRFIEESIGELKLVLLLSALATGVVCWFFLGSWSATINILLAIPTSIIGTFLIIYFFGFTLNNFTLLGLILAIGIVVDDAIMVLENIVRRQEGGLGKVEAALQGARQITFAAVAATLAIVAIFLPVAFMRGVIGKFFFQFGVTMSAAVLLSLLEALTLTPMRCSQFVATATRRTRLGLAADRWMGRATAAYQKALPFCLERRWLVVGVAGVVFLLSLTSLKFLRKEFIPAQDRSMFLVRLQTPVGSSFTSTDKKFQTAEGFLLSRPEIKRYFAAVGGFGGGEVNTGVIFITLKPKSERRLSQEALMDVVRKEFNAIPDLKATIMDLSGRGFSAQRGFPVEFSVRGPDWPRLVQLSQELKAKMESNPLFVDVDTDYQTDMPQVRVVPDRLRAAERGVSIASISRTINVAFGGMRAGRFTEGSRRSDIRVRLEEGDRLEPTDIQSLEVRNNRGEMIPLSEVTTLSKTPTLQKITRQNRERSVGIMANVGKGESQSAALAAVTEMGRLLPDGYRLVLSGSAQTFRESFSGLLFALWLGVIVAYMILASQFNSFIHPITVLLALPLALSGAFVALLLAGNSLNIYSMIGLVLLMGIVKKNSILLVDFTNRFVRTGTAGSSLKSGGLHLSRPPDYPRLINTALLEACPQRLRPILMTSFSTIAAAIPAALGLGPGAETRAPMAIAVIGGILVSTCLTLFVVPAAYSLLAKLERR